MWRWGAAALAVAGLSGVAAYFILAQRKRISWMDASCKNVIKKCKQHTRKNEEKSSNEKQELEFPRDRRTESQHDMPTDYCSTPFLTLEEAPPLLKKKADKDNLTNEEEFLKEQLNEELQLSSTEIEAEDTSAKLQCSTDNSDVLTNFTLTDSTSQLESKEYVIYFRDNVNTIVSDDQNLTQKNPNKKTILTPIDEELSFVENLNTSTVSELSFPLTKIDNGVNHIKLAWNQHENVNTTHKSMFCLYEQDQIKTHMLDLSEKDYETDSSSLELNESEMIHAISLDLNEEDNNLSMELNENYDEMDTLHEIEENIDDKTYTLSLDMDEEEDEADLNLLDLKEDPLIDEEKIIDTISLGMNKKEEEKGIENLDLNEEEYKTDTLPLDLTKYDNNTTQNQDKNELNLSNFQQGGTDRKEQKTVPLDLNVEKDEIFKLHLDLNEKDNDTSQIGEQYTCTINKHPVDLHKETLKENEEKISTLFLDCNGKKDIPDDHYENINKEQNENEDIDSLYLDLNAKGDTHIIEAQEQDLNENGEKNDKLYFTLIEEGDGTDVLISEQLEEDLNEDVRETDTLYLEVSEKEDGENTNYKEDVNENKEKIDIDRLYLDLNKEEDGKNTHLIYLQEANINKNDEKNRHSGKEKINMDQNEKAKGKSNKYCDSNGVLFDNNSVPTSANVSLDHFGNENQTYEGKKNINMDLSQNVEIYIGPITGIKAEIYVGRVSSIEENLNLSESNIDIVNENLNEHLAVKKTFNLIETEMLQVNEKFDNEKSMINIQESGTDNLEDFTDIIGLFAEIDPQIMTDRFKSICNGNMENNSNIKPTHKHFPSDAIDLWNKKVETDRTMEKSYRHFSPMTTAHWKQNFLNNRSKETYVYFSSEEISKWNDFFSTPIKIEINNNLSKSKSFTHFPQQANQAIDNWNAVFLNKVAKYEKESIKIKQNEENKGKSQTNISSTVTHLTNLQDEDKNKSIEKIDTLYIKVNAEDGKDEHHKDVKEYQSKNEENLDVLYVDHNIYMEQNGTDLQEKDENENNNKTDIKYLDISIGEDITDTQLSDLNDQRQKGYMQYLHINKEKGVTNLKANKIQEIDGNLGQLHEMVEYPMQPYKADQLANQLDTEQDYFLTSLVVHRLPNQEFMSDFISFIAHKINKTFVKSKSSYMSMLSHHHQHLGIKLTHKATPQNGAETNYQNSTANEADTEKDGADTSLHVRPNIDIPFPGNKQDETINIIQPVLDGISKSVDQHHDLEGLEDTTESSTDFEFDSISESEAFVLSPFYDQVGQSYFYNGDQVKSESKNIKTQDFQNPIIREHSLYPQHKRELKPSLQLESMEYIGVLIEPSHAIQYTSYKNKEDKQEEEEADNVVADSFSGIESTLTGIKVNDEIVYELHDMELLENPIPIDEDHIKHKIL